MHDFGPTSTATVYVDVGAARPPMVTCELFVQVVQVSAWKNGHGQEPQEQPPP
eukprot:SAG25_NODE_10516_length_331_cov_0.461207_1_plen_52_part_10